jgi:hypothetical protein
MNAQLGSRPDSLGEIEACVGAMWNTRHRLRHFFDSCGDLEETLSFGGAELGVISVMT